MNFVKSLYRQNWKIKLLYLSLAILFLFFVSLAIAPALKMREFKSLVNSDSLFIQRYDPVFNHPEMSPLVKEKAFKEALLKLAEHDSIQMVLDGSDSTVNLYLKGVRIHQVPIEALKKDKLFKHMPLNQKVMLFSQPLSVQSQTATIEKEPVVVRYAPKNEQEAPLTAWQPDTLIQNPAFVCFSMDHGIQIILEQTNNLTLQDKWQKFKFHTQLKWIHTNRAIFNFVRLKKQEYHPVITIKIPVDDLQAIYRALPNEAFMVINI